MSSNIATIVLVIGVVVAVLLLALLVSVNKLGSRVAEAAQPAAAAKPAAAKSDAAPSIVVAPQIEAGIPSDVVAAIMAAVYTMGNGKYVLKSVRRGTNGWARAGVSDVTAPF